MQKLLRRSYKLSFTITKSKGGGYRWYLNDRGSLTHISEKRFKNADEAVADAEKFREAMSGAETEII